jgi:tetratricopeptide (TPR) repeat protein
LKTPSGSPPQPRGADPDQAALRQLRDALALHRQGNLPLAEILYRQVLGATPRQARALGMLGLIEAQKGNASAALDLMARSIEANPSDPATHFNLGLLHQEQGRHGNALECFDRALQLKADAPPLWNSRAMALKALERYEEALAGYNNALRLDPNYFEATHNRAVVLRYLGRHDEAAAGFQRALELNPQSAEAHNNLGYTWHLLARFDEALLSYARALQLKPGYHDALNNCGMTLHTMGRDEEAISCYQRALALDARSVEALMNLGVSFYELRQFGPALQNLQRALEIEPDYLDVQINLGNVLMESNRGEEALASYRKVIEARPGDQGALMNMANALRDLQRHSEAMRYYEQALAIDATNADVHWNQSLCLLAMGNFERGWEEYEWRRKVKRLYDVDRRFDAPLWLGREPLQGKTILLHAEQGLGDTIQFCRYASELAAMGARVVLEVQPPLMGVLAGLRGVDQLLARGSDAGPCDYHRPLLSLPFALRTRLDTVPAAVPYLHADSQRVAKWRQEIHDRQEPQDTASLQVGIAWSGNIAYSANHRRSISLETLLAAMPRGANCWSLQKEVSEEDRALIQRTGRVRCFAQNDFVHTAAQIESMDVVISVDTSIAHLAAALGKPTWILLSSTPDWRWMSGRTSSPWYPNVTLFRQSSPGDWSSALGQVADAMRALRGG